MDEVAAIREATTLWEDGGLAWSVWMDDRYIKGRCLEENQSKMGDSVGWKGEGDKASYRNIDGFARGI